ncbi:Protein of unknown function [Reichenbachiella agariperforans]|uniref:DUF1493 family protein n=1 Tax=Reichenbachiella agariperforans TaxID=156994 RepID=A0A1M6QGT4_REIAG|nr:DUF1493 family protein [Reichenbachiella agariperforans]SHK19247.1 Protein of unknown function [Reichenbachiella agariperforans]
MSWLDEITNFLEDYTEIEQLSPDSDLFKEHGIVGDDFHEMIENFARNYNIDMSTYLWYFHADEEGQNLGSFFFKPPYARVDRIPVTPKLLADAVETKKWNVKYPEHKLPKYRIDIIISYVIIGLIIGIVIWSSLS